MQVVHSLARAPNKKTKLACVSRVEARWQILCPLRHNSVHYFRLVRTVINFSTGHLFWGSAWYDPEVHDTGLLISLAPVATTVLILPVLVGHRVRSALPTLLELFASSSSGLQKQNKTQAYTKHKHKQKTHTNTHITPWCLHYTSIIFHFVSKYKNSLSINIISKRASSFGAG